MLHVSGFCTGQYVNAYITDNFGVVREFYLILNEGNCLETNKVDKIKDVLLYGLLNDIDRETVASMLDEHDFESLAFGCTLLENARGKHRH